MKTLVINVKEIGQNNVILQDITKQFTGKNQDKESIAFLEQVHFEKMNKACINSGVGKYTPTILTKPENYGYKLFNRWCDSRQKNKNYSDVEKQIVSTLKISIIHLD